MSVSALVWPRRIGTAALTPAASSSANRVLPIPASPTTVARTGLPLVLAAPRLWPRIACSLILPTKGMVLLDERGVRSSTPNASSEESKPFARTRRLRAYATLALVSR